MRWVLNFVILFMVVSCKGKDCTQDFVTLADIENRTANDITVEVFVESFSRILTISLAAHEIKTDHILFKGNYVKTGYAKRGGGPIDAECNDEPEMHDTLISLRSSSFSVVKNCQDLKNNKSIFVEKSASCPADTHEQMQPE